jgi:hypothetical protein
MSTGLNEYYIHSTDNNFSIGGGGGGDGLYVDKSFTVESKPSQTFGNEAFVKGIGEIVGFELWSINFN